MGEINFTILTTEKAVFFEVSKHRYNYHMKWSAISSLGDNVNIPSYIIFYQHRKG